MTVGEMLGTAALALAVVLGVLVILLVVRLGRVERQMRALTRGAGPGASSLSLGEVITRQGERLESVREQTESLRITVTALDAAVTGSVQNVGLVRFNPFQDTGGDQSFALALLDKRGDGVVISSLHTRTSTRMYARPIKAGAANSSLSEEEAQAVQQAMGGKGGT
ncbi:MAG: DUF4446 family protein [Chloroflexota bacterium]|nr:DUF4446 family protein [Chloroflexota bacterium]